MLLIEASRAYGRGILKGIAKYSRVNGPWVFYKKPPFYIGNKRVTLSQLKDWGADGIIMSEQRKTKDIIAMGLPTIVIRYKGQFPSLINIADDNDMIGEMAAEHLLSCGLRQFAYCGFDDMKWSRELGESFKKRMAKAGLKTHFYKQPRARILRSWENEQRIMADWLKSLPKPVGLMICTDDRSQHVLEACRIAGLIIPDDVAIIGVENDELICELSSPPLSSIALNTQRAGYEAAKLLDRLMAGKKIANKTIVIRPTHVAVRQSTDILAIEDSEVTKAVRFIRQHCKEMIQVSDIIDVVAVSRRSLEQRFRKELGRSVLDEIRRVRIEQIAKMLVETNLSISQIALTFGYSSTRNIARYFRQKIGMSLTEYRKRYGNK